MTEAKEVVGVTSVTDKSGAANEETEKLGMITGAGPWAQVTVEMSHTKNLGNFQSARLGVAITIPCSSADVVSVDASFEFAKNWCDVKLSGMIAEMETDLKTKS